LISLLKDNNSGSFVMVMIACPLQNHKDRVHKKLPFQPANNPANQLPLPALPLNLHHPNLPNLLLKPINISFQLLFQNHLIFNHQVEILILFVGEFVVQLGWQVLDF
jgi:hypothetical protein